MIFLPFWLILSINWNVPMCVCLFVCPSHLFTPFNGLFTPTSQRPMSRLFMFSKSLGRSYGKKWSHKGCKIAAAEKSFFYGFFFHLLIPFKGLLANSSWSPMFKFFFNSQKQRKLYFFIININKCWINLGKINHGKITQTLINLNFYIFVFL